MPSAIVHPHRRPVADCRAGAELLARLPPCQILHADKGYTQTQSAGKSRGAARSPTFRPKPIASGRTASRRSSSSAHQKVYLPGVEFVFPAAGRGRPRKRHVPNVLSVAAEEMLANEKWRVAAWRKGTKGLLKARFAAVRVRVADGPPQRIGGKGMQHMPGRRGLARRRAPHRRRTEILSREPPGQRRSQNAGRHDQGALDLRAGSPATQGGTRPRPLRGPLMAGASSACLMTMIAYAFLQHRRLAATSGGKKNPLGATQADTPSRPKSRRSRLGPCAALPMPPLQKAHPQKTRIKVPK